MTTSRHRLNPLGVAFLAIAGVLSVADGARACGANEAPAAPHACCAARPSAGCGCCGPADSAASPVAATRSPEARLVLAATRAVGSIVRPPSSCGCRASDPAAPAPKSDSRTSAEGRTDLGHGEAIEGPEVAWRSSVAPARLLSPNGSPPKSPLYLRTLHLLV